MNKKQIRLLLFFSILFFTINLSSCNRNKMHIDEKKVKDDLLEQEQLIIEQKRLRREKNKAFADSIAKLSKGLQLQVDRSLNQNQPPIILDIEKARSNIRRIKYSELGENIRYVKLSHNLDKDFFQWPEALLTNNGIVISSLGGIVNFNSDGTLKEIVCKNNQLYKKEGSLYVSNKEILAKYRGAFGKPFAINNKVYYRYMDNPNNETWIMEYNLKQPRTIDFFQDENLQSKAKGIKKLQAHEKISWYENDMIALDSDHFVSKKTKWDSSKSGFFLTIQNFSGDTLSNLKDYSPVKNYTGSSVRIGEETHLYRFYGDLYFRQAYNDTIYRFASAGRAQPLYVINFGKGKIDSPTDALNPSYDLSGKYSLRGIKENNRFLFVFYTQNYVGPNTEKKGTVQYNCFVFDKNTKEQFHAYIDDKRTSNPRKTDKGLLNDLDYGITTWHLNQTENGIFYKLIRAKRIKEHLKTVRNTRNQKNRELLEGIAKYSEDDDLYIMIIE